LLFAAPFLSNYFSTKAEPDLNKSGLVLTRNSR
jgi:hypothetical protein